MSNIYLEKVAMLGLMEKEAANAYKRYLASKGQDVTGISNQSLVAAIPAAKKPGAFSTMSQKANKAGVMPSAKPSVASRVNRAIAGGPSLSAGAAARQATLKTTGQSLNSALQQHAAGKAFAAKTAPVGAKGLLGKAMGLARRHPIAAASGGALLAGVAAGRLSSSNSSTSQAYGPY